MNAAAVVSATICPGDDPTFTISGGTGQSFEWRIDGVVEATTATPSFNASSVTYTLTGVEVIDVLVYDLPLDGGNIDPDACLSTTNSITITVLNSVAVTMLSDALNETFCDGDLVTFEATSIPSATYRFSINSIVRQNTSSNTFEVSNLQNDDIVEVLVTLVSGCTATASMTMIKNEIVSAGTLSGTQAICYNTIPQQLTSLTTATLSSASATVSYMWQSSTDNINFTDTGSTSLNYQPGSLAQTTYYTRVAISELNGKTCELAITPSIEVSVSPELVGGTIEPSGDELLCFGLNVQPATLTVTGSISGLLIDYQWESSADGVSWTPISGQNGASFVPPTLTSTATLYYRRLTRSNGGGTDCEEPSDVHIIRVNDIDPGSIDIAANDTYCYATDVPLIDTTTEASSNIGALQYQWEFRTASTPWTNIVGANNNTYNPGILTETTWFKRSVTSTSSSSSCIASTNEVQINILPELNPGDVLSDQIICENTIPADITLSGASSGAGVTYQWERSTDQLNWAELTGETNTNLSFSANATETAYYRVVITSAASSPTVPVPNQTQVTLTRTLNPLAVGEDYVIYLDSGTYSFTTTGLTSDTNSIGNGLATKITNDAPGFTATYNGNGVINIQPEPTNISVAYPSSANAHEMSVFRSATGDGCVVISDAAEISLNPASTLVQTAGPINTQGPICPGDNIQAITFNWGGGATALIIENLDAAYTPTAGLGGVVTATPALGVGWYRVTGTNEVTITGTAGPTDFFRVITDGSGCDEAFIDYSINVQPVAQIPDVIMKDFNVIDYAVLTDGVNWFNNTVCQDRPDIGGGGTTVPTDFFTCFVDNGFNQLYNEFQWDLEPGTAGAIITENIQTSVITLSSATATITASRIYTVTINGTTYTATSTGAIDTVDELGTELASQITPDGDVNASFDTATDELTIIAEVTNTTYTISRANPSVGTDNASMGVPTIAIATQKATVNWDPLFSGTATIKVRTSGCGPASDWYQVPIEVVPESVPSLTVSDVTSPFDLSVIDPNFGAILCNGTFTGVVPDCQIDIFTPATTQFFTSTDGATNNYGSLEWRITNPIPGNPAVISPGTFNNINTGVLSWNVGWWGQFDVEVRPVACDGTNGDWSSTTFNIGSSETDRPNIIPITALPECPIPAGGFQTTLRVPDFPVRWFISDLTAIQTGGGVGQNTVISNARRELAADGGSNDQEITLNWIPNYSGTIIMRAIPRDCPGSSRNYAIVVPGAADIRLIAGSNPNQIICPGDTIADIRYELLGSATGVISDSMMNLPPGIRANTTQIKQTSLITLSAVVARTITTGNQYDLTIDANDYPYVVQAGDDIDSIGNGLAAAVAGVVSASYDDATNTLTLESNVAGQAFSVVVNPPFQNAVAFSAPTSNGNLNVVTLSGTPLGTASGTYNYNITTTGGTASCTQDTIDGLITVSQPSNITLSGGDLDETVCDGTSLTEIRFTIENALSADIDDADLPPGVVDNFSGGVLTISGIPNVNPLNPTPFNYTVTTVNNISGCTPEATMSGQIIVTPAPNIEPEPGTQFNQTVCAFEPITNIQFTVSNPGFGLAFVPAGTNLPAGVSGTLATRNQVTEVTFGGGAGLAGDLTLTLNSGTPFTFSAAATSTADDAGAALATAIDSDTDYGAVYNSPVLTITHNNSGVTFSTVADNGTTNITMADPDIVTTPAIFTISGSPSITLINPQTFTYELEATGPSCTGTTSNVSGTITVNPVTSATVDPAFGANDQTVCDNVAITTISVNTVGAATVIADASNPAWLNFSPIVGDNFTISGTPAIGNLQQQSFEYSFTVQGGSFGCSQSTSTITGVITVDPAEQLILTSDASTENQNVCLNEDIVDIVYEFRGSADAVAFASPIGLPPGVDGNYIPRNQVSEITLQAGTTVATETYIIYIDSTPYNITVIAGEDEDSIGGSLATQIDGDPDVGATYDTAANKIIITADVAGDSFGIFVPSNTNAVQLQRPILATSPGIYRISGRPTGIVSGTFNYTLSTPGINCAADTTVGTITVSANSSITLTSGNDNQVVCDNGVFADMVYSISGGVRGITTTGLPNGIRADLDDPLNPTSVILSGTPLTNDTGVNIYNFSITTTANQNGCEEMTINGTITIEPNDSLTLSSTLASTNQDACEGFAIDPIVYEFAGGANGVSVTGLPPGVNDIFISRKQVSSVRFTGPNVNANEVYSIVVDNVSHTVTSTGGESPTQIATDISTIINAQSSVVSASLNGSVLILTALNDGQAFSVDSEKSALAQLTIDDPILENGTGILSITGTPTINAIVGGATTPYNLTITTVNANGCTNAIELATIRVNPNSTVTVTTASTTLDQTLCNNTDIDVIEFTIGGGATFAIVDGLPSGVGMTPLGGGSFRISGRPVVPIVVPTPYSFTVTTTGNTEGCEEATFTGTIVVSPDDGISLSVGSGPEIQTVCEGTDPTTSAIATITYTLSGGANSANITGLPAGIQTIYNPGTREYSIFGLPTVTITNTTQYNYTITTSGTCSSDSATGRITVTPKAKLVLTTTTDTLDQTVCDNTSIANIQFDLFGSANNAVGSGFPNGVGLGPIVGNTITISGTPVVNVVTPTTYSFTVTATGDGSGCEEEVLTGKIIVLPNDRLTLINPIADADQTLCVGTNPAISSLTTITYELSGGANSADIVGLPPGFSVSYDATTKRYSISGTALTDVAITTVYNYTVTTSGTCAPVTEVGRITIIPKAKITVTSASPTLDQTVCDNSSITNITFDIGGSAVNASTSGLPFGVNVGPIVGNTITISGSPVVNVSTPTTYSFTVTATGNGTCEEESFSGRIIVLPNDELTHISGNKDQTICNGTDATNPALTPIVFEIGGGATSAIVTGLPDGMSFTYSSTTKRVVIDGRPSVTITTPTNYDYTVTTIGSCSDTTDTGRITVNPLSSIVLTSLPNTSVQVGTSGVCDGTDSIVDITYTYGGGANFFAVTGLPPGIDAVPAGVNQVRIFGIPDTGDTYTRIWDYTITTIGNPCAPEASLSGQIQVNPSPVINRSFIQITEISCKNAFDGKLEVPADIVSAISGGQSSNEAQIDQLSITGNFNIDDRVRVRINGTQFEYFVKGSAFNSGVAESNNLIAQGLATLINNNNPAAVPVTANAVGANITLTSDTSGVPFTISYPVPRVQTGNTGSINDTTINANQTLNYTIQWTGTGINPPINNLVLDNLGPGDYQLEVTVDGNCAATESFTLTEPDELEISDPIACGGVITAQASGGTTPYTYLVRNFSTGIDYGPFTRNGAYTGATPQITINTNDRFRVDVTDANGCVKQSAEFTMPPGLTFTALNTRVVDDYCLEQPNNFGGGSIELQTTSGLAFTGGSGLFTYSWSGPNGYTNSTMNITNLLPGAYQVTAIDQLFGCDETVTFTIDQPDPIVVAPTGGTQPAPVTGASGVADSKVTITCPGEEFVLEVQAQGGGTAAYTYTWTRNGVQIASGPDNQLISSQAGVYNVDVSIDLSANDIPYQKTAADLICTASYSFEVVEPTTMSVLENNDRRIVPACSDDLAELVFNVVGGNDNAGPYTLSLQNGALSASSGSASDREIVITGIDASNLGQISLYTITDANGCSATATLTVPINLPSFENVSFQVVSNDIDCAAGEEGSIEISLAQGTPDLSQIGIQISSSALNFNYFTNWSNASTAGGNPVINIDNAGVYNYRIIGVPAQGTTTNTTSTNTTICELDSGTIEIQESDNNQILLRNIESVQPGCGQTGGSILLTFDENTIPPTMTVNWEKFTTTTVSTTSGTINTQEWRRVPSFDNNLSLSELENGTYRAIIASNAGGTCGSGEIITRSIVIGNAAGLTIRNSKYVDAASNDYCSDPINLLYDIKFLLENDLASSSGGAFEVTLSKISSYGNPFNSTFPAGSSAGITRPLTNDGTGNYTISNVPFGEYQLVVSESGTVTQSVCEVLQTIIIPEVQPLEYVGDLEYVLDTCTKEVEITAMVQGGVPFVSPSGDSFYRYQWTLDIGGGQIVNYAGETITVREPGNLSLTIFDSTGCQTSATSGTAITIAESISPYRILPRLASNTLFAEEPTCQNAAKDDGKIQFEVVGGDLPQGGQYPYEIIWEKFDVGTGSYLEQDGTNGQANLFMQSFAFNLTPGQYKVSVAPMNWSCVGVSPYQSIGAIEYITVPQNDDLVITNGPFIDVSEYDFTDPSQLTICEPGGAGNLYVKVFNNYDGELFFYYPTDADLVVKQQIDNTTFRLQISSSVASGTLTVVNEEGCRVSKGINLEIGQPNFDFSSLNSQISGNSTQTQMPLILARENVTFTNTSTGTYSYLEWDFGDGSPVERFTPFAGTSSPVTHIYGISGTFYPKLRLYNSVGCYQEVIKTLVVGKGYNVLIPNVFTPNGDTYNDKFKPLFSGFKSMQFTIYDYRGNLLYMEESEVDPANPLQPIDLTGWDGEIKTESPYYIYSVYGVTLFGDIEVQKSGTFIIIR